MNEEEIDWNKMDKISILFFAKELNIPVDKLKQMTKDEVQLKLDLKLKLANEYIVEFIKETKVIEDMKETYSFTKESIKELKELKEDYIEETSNE